MTISVVCEVVAVSLAPRRQIPTETRVSGWYALWERLRKVQS
jgi:hypothetical protein